jgi:hypothetical protein
MIDPIEQIERPTQVVTDELLKSTTFILHGTEFSPYEHMVKITGRGGTKDYLPYVARCAWFRAHRPKGKMKTEIVFHDLEKGSVLIKAYVDDGEGVTAEAYGSCTKAEFPGGYIEKAETKAKNRALADLGYGTLAAQELIDDDQGGSVSDTPLPQRQTPKPESPKKPQNNTPQQSKERTSEASNNGPRLMPVEKSAPADVAPAQPTPVINVPTPSQLRVQCEDLFGANKWDDTLMRIFRKVLSDEEMNPDRCEAVQRQFNSVIEKRRAKEQQRAS